MILGSLSYQLKISLNLVIHGPIIAVSKELGSLSQPITIVSTLMLLPRSFLYEYCGYGSVTGWIVTIWHKIVLLASLWFITVSLFGMSHAACCLNFTNACPYFMRNGNVALIIHYPIQTSCTCSMRLFCFSRL